MEWRIIDRISEDEVIITDGSEKVLVVYEHEPELRRESGWWIKRIWWDDLNWRDFTTPGYGETYWVKVEVAKELGLIDRN